MPALAKMIGINGSLMRQNKKGNTYVLKGQLEKIQNFMNTMGTIFNNSTLFNTDCAVPVPVQSLYL